METSGTRATELPDLDKSEDELEYFDALEEVNIHEHEDRRLEQLRLRNRIFTPTPAQTAENQSPQATVSSEIISLPGTPKLITSWDTILTSSSPCLSANHPLSESPVTFASEKPLRKKT